MVSISKFGDSAIKFTFDDSDHYLMGDGEITVPVNGLILVLDESNMATFKKIDGDPFISFNIADSNFSSKSDLETFYKDNMVGSTGGGGVTSGDVETMISEATSGLAESSAVTEEISEAVSGKADTSAVTASINAVSGAIPTQYVKEARVDNDEGKQRWYVFQKEGQNAFNIYNFSINGRMPLSRQNGTYKNVDNFSLVETSAVTSAITSSSTNSQVASAKAVYDAIGDKADTTAVTASINAAVSGKVDTSVFNTYSASTDARISEDEEVTSAALNELNDALDDKADIEDIPTVVQTTGSSSADVMSQSAVTASINAVSGAIPTSYINSIQPDSDQGYQRMYRFSTPSNFNYFILRNAKINGRQVLNQGWSTDVNEYNLVETSAITSSVTSASTDSEVPSAKAVYDALQEGGGGGGKAISAGTNISVTTGATADTINCTLPITAGTNNGIIIGDSECSASGLYSLAIGHNSDANAMFSIVVGSNSTADGSTNFVYGNNCKATTSNSRLTFIFGDHIEISRQFTSAFGKYLNIKNDYEHSFGKYNVSNTGSTESGNTIFSVGNGTDNARHNAFEIRQNGDIYITKDGSDVKLQDQLGGGGLPESAFTAYTASTDARLAEDEEVTAAALNTLNDVIDDKADASAFTAHTADTTIHTTSAEKTSWNGAATNASNAITALGGLKLVSLTQAQYDALVTKDSSTLYIITSSN